MLDEKSADPASRYLIVNGVLSGKMISAIKGSCIKLHKDKGLEPELYEKFIDWQPGNNELLLMTLYAYADVRLPVSYDVLFNLNNVSQYENVNCIILQSVFNGWFPIDKIEHGHKHACVTKFAHIPQLIQQAAIIENVTDLNNSETKLGLCSANDFPHIVAELQNK